MIDVISTVSNRDSLGEQRPSDMPYPNPIKADGERFETWEAFVHTMSWGGEVVVQFGEHAVIHQSDSLISVSPVAIQWFGQIPEAVFDANRVVGTVRLSELNQEIFEGFVRKAEHARKSRLRRCRVCATLTLPEYRAEGLCQACFEFAGGAF